MRIYGDDKMLGRYFLIIGSLSFYIPFSAEIWLAIHRHLRKKHSKTYLRKNSKTFLDKFFYVRFRKDIPAFWFYYNIFVKAYVTITPIVGIYFAKSEDLLDLYLNNIFVPIFFFSCIIWLIDGFSRFFNKE